MNVIRKTIAASAVGVLAFGAFTCYAGVRAESRWSEPQLRWYASRASVACTGVPASGAELRIVDSSDRVVCERAIGGIRAVVAVTNGFDGFALLEVEIDRIGQTGSGLRVRF